MSKIDPFLYATASITARKLAAVTTPVYPCATAPTDNDIVYPADKLGWVENNKHLKDGWYCFHCYHEYVYDDCYIEFATLPKLSDFLAEVKT